MKDKYISHSLFITGTGTDVGKTYVSALIVKKMRESDYNCGYYKPVLSGAVREHDHLVPGDCKYVIETANLNTTPMDSLTYCFEESVSPHLAAKKNNIIIDPKKIIEGFNTIKSKYDYLLIEGAGGITCPLVAENSDIYLMSDLIKDLGVETLLVADGGLGTINSVLTTVEYAKNNDITIKGIILNNYDKDNYMHIDNLQMIEKLTKIKVVCTISKNCNNLNIDKNKLESLFS